MKLRLKEDPREWCKFTWVLWFMLSALMGVAVWKGRMAWETAAVIAATAALPAGLSLIRPHWFRGIYRTGMRASFLVGRCVGTVLLLLVFWIVATPTGLLMRLLGKDPLDLHAAPFRKTHWKPAPRPSDWTRQF